ncbi:hypothetical protein AVEN_197552-1 [Araneus ventricosus]|uniref:Endonuclease/exonuclease/phosphatase domain-containing protein n=1 Tax=Araneus ventricosus TaxID=182803 RepID=A0A4Y2BRR3_ARAVE|nr:hypothetical protein AVEN_197552-1 [Araneus ventricosus]
MLTRSVTFRAVSLILTRARVRNLPVLLYCQHSTAANASLLHSALTPPLFFNLHHPLWGFNDSSRLGNKFAFWIMNSNFVILNISTPTHTSPAGNQSLLDLTPLFKITTLPFGLFCGWFLI